eukprot:gene13730-15793_t
MNRNRVNPTCAELYTLGLPELQFTKLLSHSTHHASNHVPATFVEKNIFQTLPEFNDTYASESLQYGSCILNSPVIRSRHVSFGGEVGIQSLVENLLNDVIRLADLSEIVRVGTEWAYTTEDGSKHSAHKPDHWIVYYNGKPVAVVEVKSPESDMVKQPLKVQPNILDHPNVIGQLYDYILGHQSFHGQHHVFAILTTMRDFRIAWLPHSDAYAASDTDAPPTDSVIEPVDPSNRILHCTPLIPHTDAHLARILVSAIKKSAGSTFGTVYAFSHARMYLQLVSHAWYWHRLPLARAQRLQTHATLNLTASANRSSHYTIIKSLHRTANCKVWVVVAGDTERVCIAKQLFDVEKLDQEQQVWCEANQHTGVFRSSGSGKPLVVMPYVVLAREINGVVSFNTDFHTWAADDNSTAGPVPSKIFAELSQTAELITALGWNPLRAATTAAARFAQRGILHQDLEWRHIGMLPIFDKQGNVVDVRPVFVDFDLCQTGVEEGLALQTMQARLAFLAQDVEFQ